MLALHSNSDCHPFVTTGIRLGFTSGYQEVMDVPNPFQIVLFSAGILQSGSYSAKLLLAVEELSGILKAVIKW